MIQDSFGRTINYLRIAITDRCNLRCQYCIPNDSIQFLERKSLLTYEEWLRLISVFEDLGITKIRISGGEPLIRKDVGFFLKEVKKLKKIKSFGITTNGTHTLNYLDQLEGFAINLSLDSINPEKFNLLTQRDHATKVLNCMHELLKLNRLNKINAVILKDQNLDSLSSMPALLKDHDVQLRFIESMPFNGQKNKESTLVSATEMQSIVKQSYPSLYKVPDEENATANLFKIKDFKGTLGFIPAFTRTICGQCNRIRVTPEGQLKTCLYDQGVLSLRDLLRAGATDQDLQAEIINKVNKKPKDGFEAEGLRKLGEYESMTKIGG